MSFRNPSGIVKPSFNPLAINTPTTYYDQYSWGRNTVGQLGLGDTTSRSSPTQVGSLTTWSKVFSFSYNASCFAIKTDGTLWSWGYNAEGQLGDGSATGKSSPVQVGVLTNWLTTAAGGYQTLAIG